MIFKTNVKYANLISMILFSTIIAQNEVPTITNISIEINKINQSVTTQYDLDDTDDDSIQVALNIFRNDNQKGPTPTFVTPGAITPRQPHQSQFAYSYPRKIDHMD